MSRVSFKLLLGWRFGLQNMALKIIQVTRFFNRSMFHNDNFT